MLFFPKGLFCVLSFDSSFLFSFFASHMFTSICSKLYSKTPSIHDGIMALYLRLSYSIHLVYLWYQFWFLLIPTGQMI
ncbi:uncharacterized protein F4822DRAFT_146867 [Hypoxylon trugodes]|uniref:uncharacterized protein n=1 Tax=Hypoxylon trugodes TaxID=326681 RepID=UPI002194131E|nr:uncharacterized protein F4822DRAFT_146867 [Hypoxylon trugodes]KAI1392956.1 hypothetical protein F4822DRAFT_146867 [Hypoxylon trugodes]